jgi:hypothetical protein
MKRTSLRGKAWMVYKFRSAQNRACKESRTIANDLPNLAQTRDTNYSSLHFSISAVIELVEKLLTPSFGSQLCHTYQTKDQQKEKNNYEA